MARYGNQKRREPNQCGAGRNGSRSNPRGSSRTPVGSIGRGIGEGMKDDPPNLLILVMSIIIGLVTQYMCGIVYNNLVMSIPRPLLIGLMFLILSAAVIICVSVISHAKGYYQDDLMDGVLPFGDRVPVVLITLLLGIALISTLFQFIYGLGGIQKQNEPTSYVFLIDDSGSMVDNDPEDQRFSAIGEILDSESVDFPYMVYRFADNTIVEREMAPKNEDTEELTGSANGGTSIKGSLKQVIKDYKNGIWDGGDHPRVILLTDGYATDMSFVSRISKILRDYRRSGISVSTVGLGDVDEGLMNKIAKETGGVFISVDKASQLSSAMRNAAVMTTDRDLLTTRYSEGMDALYAIMRIVFLLILGLMIGLATMIAYGDDESNRIAMITTGVTALLGALMMELGTNLFAWDEGWMWRIMWMLFALTLVLRHTGFDRFRQRDLSDNYSYDRSSYGGGGPYS